MEPQMNHVRWLLCHTVIAVLCAGLVACSGGGTFITGLLPTDVTVTVNPNAVEATQNAMGTVTISPAAPAGGFKVLVSSNNPAATPPGALVVIPAGSTSATFIVNTTNVASQTIANITAMLMPAVTGTNVGAMLTIDPATTAQVQSLTTLPTMVTGGVSLTGTVTLNSPPTNPAAVTLTSSNPAVLAFPPAGGGTSVSPSSVQITTGNTV